MRVVISEKFEKIIMYILIVLALVAFFILNWLTPIQYDDWSYSFNFATKTRIASFYDIFQSLDVNYHRVNGRLPVHFLAHLFLWIGKDAFNFINTIAFAGLNTLICFHAFGTFCGKHLYAWLASFAGLWLLTPAFGESFLWVTGASNYLYGILIILLYLIPFRLSFDKDYPKDKAWYTLLALVFGIIAGWTNENTGGALAVMLFCLTIWRLIQKKRVPLWWLTGFCGVIIGVLIMIFAPGELSRLSGAGGMGGLHAILVRAYEITLQLLHLFWPGIILWVLLFLAFLYRKQDGRKLCFPLISLLTGLAATYSMALAPGMPLRTWSGPLVFFLISLISLWNEISRRDNHKNGLYLALLSLCTVLLLINCYFTAQKLAVTKEVYVARDVEAAAQLAQGKQDLILDAVHGSDSRFDAAGINGDISSDSDYWVNVQLARYYGANSVVAKGR